MILKISCIIIIGIVIIWFVIKGVRKVLNG